MKSSSVDNRITQISEAEGIKILDWAPLAGGDINEVFRCGTPGGELVLKLNKHSSFPQIFAKEINGLEALRRAEAFTIPEVRGTGEIGDWAYLLLEYLPPRPPDSWSDFGALLARQHRLSNNDFGFHEWNYIGRLRQPNGSAKSAAEFLCEQRLRPQFTLAKARGFSFPGEQGVYEISQRIIPDEPPALLHGDLWSGNFLYSDQGFALIDPAVSYGPREMDLAMMHLFGGFPRSVFRAYEEHYPTQPGLAERLPLYQLYYLLVHVNMFGAAYYERTHRLIESLVGR